MIVNSILMLNRRSQEAPVLRRKTNRIRQRRHVKRHVYWVVLCGLFLYYHNHRLYDYMQSLQVETDIQQKTSTIFVRGTRESRKFSDFVSYNANTTFMSNHNDMTIQEARQGRERILSILEKDLKISDLTVDEILMLPKWSQVQRLYGDRPVIIGMETCQEYQSRVPLERRHLGVAGIFNSGTTAFGLSLQANCKFPDRGPAIDNNNNNNNNNSPVTNVNGMLSQVPWAKHKMARERNQHTILDSIRKTDVLPIVLVRDPYYWLQSMCKQGYGVRWNHNPEKHCPNLVPNEYDLKRFPKLQNQSSVPVWMGASMKRGPNWDSLIHYWNDWYRSYYKQQQEQQQEDSFPRLIIRFEDTLFHAPQVMKQVCNCGGGIYADNRDNFRYIMDEAKWDHKHKQNNLVSAMIKYGGSDMSGRYRQMTGQDLEFAKQTLDQELIHAFHYKKE